MWIKIHSAFNCMSVHIWKHAKKLLIFLIPIVFSAALQFETVGRHQSGIFRTKTGKLSTEIPDFPQHSLV